MPLPKRLFTSPALAHAIAQAVLPANVVPIREQRNAESDQMAILKTKIDRVHRLLSALEERAAACDRQVKRAQARKKATTAKAERVEERVLKLMQHADLAEVIGHSHTLTRRACGVPKLVVDDEAQIPPEYMRETLISEPDKLQIKAALAKDLPIAGVHLEQTVSLIRK
jgi:hypothetical protein